MSDDVGFDGLCLKSDEVFRFCQRLMCFVLLFLFFPFLFLLIADVETEGRA